MACGGKSTFEGMAQRGQKPTAGRGGANRRRDDEKKPLLDAGEKLQTEENTKLFVSNISYSVSSLLQILRTIFFYFLSATYFLLFM